MLELQQNLETVGSKKTILQQEECKTDPSSHIIFQNGKTISSTFYCLTF